MPEWVLPTGLALLLGALGWLLRTKMNDMSRSSSEALVEVKKIHETMLRPSDLKNAVLEMGNALQDRFSREYYTRREAEALERKAEALERRVNGD